MKRYSKYHARPMVKLGVKFDSGAEAARYQELLLLERAGEITDLQDHPRFCIIPGFTHQGKRIRASYYEADFTYYEDGKFVVEDVKGSFRPRKDGKKFTTETPLFKLKWKLMMSLYPDWVFRIYRKGE